MQVIIHVFRSISIENYRFVNNTYLTEQTNNADSIQVMNHGKHYSSYTRRNRLRK